MTDRDPAFVRHLGALPFPALGPVTWRSCRRGLGSHAYSPSAGFASLGLSHAWDDPQGAPQHLDVAVTAVTPTPDSTARSVREAVRRMTTFAEAAVITWEGTFGVRVAGDRRTFQAVVLDDGQWSATAVDGDWHVSLAAHGWPREGLELVEVDPLQYLASS